jgi:hypothetical protein
MLKADPDFAIEYLKAELSGSAMLGALLLTTAWGLDLVLISCRCSCMKYGTAT